jgi:hypothetical protein
MDCPKRPCECGPGAPHRKELSARIRRQEILHNSPYMTAKEQTALLVGDDPQPAPVQESSAPVEA